MSFAEAYLEKVSLDPGIDNQAPSPNLSMVIAIPASNEPGLMHTVHAIRKCTRPDGDVELIIALNSRENAPAEVINQNRRSEAEIRDFIRDHSKPGFRLLYTHRSGITGRHAGAGFARKIAMDHALSRFGKLDRPEGIILSLDADTLCEGNYLTAIEDHFQKVPKSRACSVYFEHPLEGAGFPESVYKGITEYELHLRYYIQGLRHAGHPHAHHTIGSAFCVRANVYAGQGGMNRRTAGEDFYFLQKIIPLGQYHDLNTTCLFPSPRPSGRVAFGTGPVVRRFFKGSIKSLDSYNPDVFRDLGKFISVIPLLYPDSEDEIKTLYDSLPESIRADLEGEFFERLGEIRKNSAGEESFRKRFFRWFNMFRTLKYINSAHRSFYSKIPVQKAAGDFLRGLDYDIKPGADARDLLMFLRKIQRESNWPV